MRRFLPLLFSAACATHGAGSEPLPPDGPPPDCEGGERYPQGAVEPMALGEVLTPHSWPTALHRDGRRAALDLGAVPCNSDPDIDWSPFDVLLFVSIPAW